MKVNPKIFKSYDIRGIVPEELSSEMAFQIGKAFVELTKAKHIVIGRDMRISSPEIFEFLLEGIISQGVKAYNAGLIPTEALYFAVANYDYDAGIMVTASHNPKEYNGFKMVVNKENLELITGKDLLKASQKEISDKSLGEIDEINIWEDFINHLLKQACLTRIKPLKVVVDASNGMAGKVIPLIKDKLPAEIVSLNFDLDGNFPSHPPNPLEKESLKDISKTVIKEKADFGLIFDGDADRIYLIDERGEFVKGDITLLLLAKHVLEDNPGRGVAYNLICSRAVPRLIKKWGGKPIKTPVGVINVRNGMLKNDGVLGGELSGHYMLKESYYLDSGFIVFLMLLQLISQTDIKVSQIVKEFSFYAKSPELNFKVKDKKKVIEEFKKKYGDGKQEEMDGLTVEYSDWWFNIRPSNTEPLLRLTVEADNQDILEKKIKELKTLIK